jgi:hypothetical protein
MNSKPLCSSIRDERCGDFVRKIQNSISADYAADR